MEICEEISEIERITMLNEMLKADINDFSNINYDKKLLCFYNLLFINKFDNVLPIANNEIYYHNVWECADDVIKSFHQNLLGFLINYKDYSFVIKYSVDNLGNVLDIDIQLNGFQDDICIKRSINFNIEDLSELMEQQYQLILDRFEKLIQKDKMFNKNINFMKELIGIEI